MPHIIEYQRLSTLSSFDLDFTDTDPELELIAKLAAQVCRARISLVNIIDRNTQWSLAGNGMATKQMPREDSVCQRTIESSSCLEIKNLSSLPDFADKSFVNEGPKLNYYFGVPLKTENGVCLGALCVMDNDNLSLSSEQKKSMESLSDLVVKRLEAIKLNREKDEKLNEVKKDKRKLAHDICGPVGGIAGVCELLKEELMPHLSSETEQLFELIKQSSQSVLDLSDNLLKEDAALAERYNCPVLAEKLEQLFIPQAYAKGVGLSISYDKTSAERVSFSPQYLLQICGNLITNAIKFTAEGGQVAVFLKTEMKESGGGANLCITVKDNGSGMNQAAVNGILSGHPESTVGTAGEQGHGIGLQQVRELIEERNGRLEISSELGQGAEFTVTFPV